MIYIKRLFSPPVFSDPEQTNIARHIFVFTWVAIGIMLLYTFLLPILAPQLSIRIIWMVILISFQVPVLFLIRRGFIRQATLFSLSSFWIVIAITTAISGGIISTPYSGNLLLILIAAITLGWQIAFFYAVLSFLEGVALVWLELQGYLPPLSTTPQTALLLQTVLLIIGASTLHLATFSVKDALGKAKKELNERKRAQAALQASETRYRNFIEQSIDGIWMLAFDHPIPVDIPAEDQVHLIQNTGYIAESNDAIARMYGYDTSQDFKGTRLLSLYGNPPSEINFHATLKLVQSGYRSGNRETEEVTKDGKKLYFLNNAVGIIRDNHLYELWGTQKDITDKKMLFDELESRNAELERFTYTVSHDLKTPLVTVRGYLGFLEKDIQIGNNAQIRKDIDRIIEATDLMQRLLKELLDLSRIGRVMNPPESVPFDNVVQAALVATQSTIKAKRVKIEVAPDLPIVYGDRNRLVEVVQNLVDNACNFMGDQPAPLIQIGAENQENPQSICLYIRDNGIGIEPQYHEQIFGLFNKLDNNTDGSGIGLALVKRIIEVHGGRIWVESEGFGSGSTFLFTLPMMKNQE